MNFSTPINKKLSFTIEGKPNTTAPISRLLFLRRPIAVLRSVTQIIISALNRVRLTRTFAHVSKEIFKVFPTLANSNSATTVFRIMRIGRIGTSAKHLAPNFIKKCTALSVSCVHRLRPFNLQTTATSGVSASQAVRDRCCRTTAIAVAKPSTSTAVSHNNKSVKPLTSDIAKIAVTWKWLKRDVKICISHSVFSSVENGLVRLGDVLNARLRAVSILARI